MDKNIIIEIEKEYTRIDKRWLKLHFKTSFGLVLFSLIVESIMGLLVCNSDLLTTTLPIYIFKYLATPFVVNIIFILINYKVLKSQKFPQKTKIYITSLILVLICFVLFTVHIFFPSVYFMFVVAILLTTVYADYKLSSITAAVSIFLLIISELFIKWDSDKVSIFASTDRLMNFFVSLFILMIFSTVCVIVIRFEKEKNTTSIQKELERHQLVQKLKIDDLTGIFNRSAFRDEINKMVADDSLNTYIFAMIDIDNFKSINDTFGHIVGDHCLIGFSEILVSNCDDAIPFRFGGDEFCILFKNRTMRNVIDTCEKIQKDFLTLDLFENAEVSLTASFGLAHYKKTFSSSKLIFNTDKALYQAKIVKNKIHVYED